MNESFFSFFFAKHIIHLLHAFFFMTNNGKDTIQRGIIFLRMASGAMLMLNIGKTSATRYFTPYVNIDRYYYRYFQTSLDLDVAQSIILKS